MYYYRKTRRGMTKKNKIILYTVIVLVLLMFVFIFIDARLKPILLSASSEKARTIGINAINTAVAESLGQIDITYNDLVHIERDSDGEVCAIQTDSIAVNQLKSELTMAISDEISEIKETSVFIPVGNLISGELLSGRGPRIEVKLYPVGSAVSDITNNFSAAGINQTRHQIVMNVTAKIGMVLPTQVNYTEVTSSIVLCETVIIGKVPDYYTDIEGLSKDAAGDIILYGKNYGG